MFGPHNHYAYAAIDALVFPVIYEDKRMYTLYHTFRQWFICACQLHHVQECVSMTDCLQVLLQRLLCNGDAFLQNKGGLP